MLFCHLSLTNNIFHSSTCKTPGTAQTCCHLNVAVKQSRVSLADVLQGLHFDEVSVIIYLPAQVSSALIFQSYLNSHQTESEDTVDAPSALVSSSPY